jgi:predicted transcriptional regulator
MSALTVRLSDEKHQRLKALAKTRGTPLNRLIDEMTTLMLAEFDAETRFQIRAARGEGKAERGLELLDKVDSHFAAPSGGAI